MIRLLKKRGKAWTLITDKTPMKDTYRKIEHTTFGSSFSTHLPPDRVIISGKHELLNSIDCKAHITWNWCGFYNQSGVVDMSVLVNSVVLSNLESEENVWTSKEAGYALESRWWTNKTSRPYSVTIDLDNHICVVEFLSEL